MLCGGFRGHHPPLRIGSYVRAGVERGHETRASDAAVEDFGLVSRGVSADMGAGSCGVDISRAQGDALLTYPTCLSIMRFKA